MGTHVFWWTAVSLSKSQFWWKHWFFHSFWVAMDLIRCPKVLGKIFGPPRGSVGCWFWGLRGSNLQLWIFYLFVSHTCQYERMKVCKHYWGHMHITHTHFCTHTCSKFHTCACDCTQTPTCVLMCKKIFFKKSPPDFFQYSERTIGSTETNNSSKERSDAQFFWSLKDYGMAISVVCYFNLPLKHRSANSLI